MCCGCSAILAYSSRTCSTPARPRACCACRPSASRTCWTASATSRRACGLNSCNSGCYLKRCPTNPLEHMPLVHPGLYEFWFQSYQCTLAASVSAAHARCLEKASKGEAPPVLTHGCIDGAAVLGGLVCRCAAKAGLASTGALQAAISRARQEGLCSRGPQPTAGCKARWFIFDPKSYPYSFTPAVRGRRTSGGSWRTGACGRCPRRRCATRAWTRTSCSTSTTACGCAGGVG